MRSVQCVVLQLEATRKELEEEVLNTYSSSERLVQKTFREEELPPSDSEFKCKGDTRTSFAPTHQPHVKCGVSVVSFVFCVVCAH